MKAKVTDQGVLIPRDWLNGAKEVEIRREGNALVIVLIPAEDPIRSLGRAPIAADVDDASSNHDWYLCQP